MQGDMLWGETGAHRYTITAASIKTSLQSGDQVQVNWYDSSGDYFDYSIVSSSSVTPPSGAYGAKIVLTSSSSSGDRWAWWSSATSSHGDTTHFPDPDTGGSGGGGGGDVIIDLSPVVNEIQVVQGQLVTIIGKLDDLIANGGGGGGTGGDFGDVVAAIQSQTSAIGTKFNQVNGNLETIQWQLDTLDSHVVDIYDYISTPRTAAPFSVDMPEIIIDPTPPPIGDPPQPPYKYNRQPKQPPPFADSPGPLPFAPDPFVMEHDPPATINPPTQIEQPRELDPVNIQQPIERDPANVQQPRDRDPVNVEQPRDRDPVNLQQPIERDPVNIQQPRAQDPVSVEQPITQSPIIQRSEPIQAGQPLQPAPPVTPDPPL